MNSRSSQRRMKVAIVGCGPSGLGAAIQMQRLPFVELIVYEKRPKICELGGGFTLQPHTWGLLEQNGVAKHIRPNHYFRSPEGCIDQRRNGRTGELLLQKFNPEDIPPSRRSCRIARAGLQQALLEEVDQTRLHLKMKLVDVQHTAENRVRITFENGLVDEADLLIAADGIRSQVRRFSFPDHSLRYNGQSVYRTIVSKTEVSKIDGIPWAPAFWKHASGLYVYTCPLGDDEFEVTARIRRRPDQEPPVSWGRQFDLHTLLDEYQDFCAPVRRVLRLAAEGCTQEFALFSGPHLDRIVFHDNIAFIGDASHALLGNFGSGAAFALEDVYTLGRALEWAWDMNRTLAEALNLFNSIRSPHYQRLHKLMDTFANIKTALRKEHLSIDDDIAERIRRISLASDPWMFYYDIESVVDAALSEASGHRTHVQIADES